MAWLPIGPFITFDDDETPAPAPPPPVTPSITPGLPTTPVPSTPDAVETERQFSITTSEYGRPIPIVFGGDILAGNIIWASNVVKVEATGTGSRTEYYIDIAVAFAEGVIPRVWKLWRGDTLIYSEDEAEPVTPQGDDTIMPSRTMQWKFYSGSETQLPNLTIAAVEGYDFTPAYRGTSYILFQDLFLNETAIEDLRIEVQPDTALTPAQRLTAPIDDGIMVDTNNTAFIRYDHRTRALYISARDGSANEGVKILDGADFQPLNEYLFPTAFGANDGIVYATQNGYLVIHSFVGNAGITGVIEGWSGTVVYEQETPSGTISSHGPDGLTASSALGAVLPAVFDGQAGNAILTSGFIAHRAGLIFIPDSGGHEYIGQSTLFFDKTLTKYCPVPARANGDNVLANDVDVTESIVAAVVGWDVDEQVDIAIQTVAITADSEILVQGLGSVSVEEYAGAAELHNVQHAFYAQGRLVFFVTADSRYWATCVDLNENTILWNTELDYGLPYSSNRQGSAGQSTIGTVFAFIDTGAGMTVLNLVTGEATRPIPSLSARSLPAISPSSQQWYDGDTDSIFYTSDQTGSEIVKLPAQASARATYPVAQIIRKLLARIGIYKNRIRVDDPVLLAVRGYTMTRQTLRQTFGELGAILQFDVVQSGELILFKTRGGSSVATITYEDLSPTADGWLPNKVEHDLSAVALSVEYRDVDRDFKPNVQSLRLPSFRPTYVNEEAGIDIAAPIAMTADEAITLAEIGLISREVNASSFDGDLPFNKYIELDPGDVVTLEIDEAQETTARIRSLNVRTDSNVVTARFTKHDPLIFTESASLFGTGGRYVKGAPKPDPLMRIVPTPIPWLNDDPNDLEGTWPAFFAVLNRTASNILPFTTLAHRPQDPDRATTVQPPRSLPTWGFASGLRNTHAAHSVDNDSVVVVRLQAIGAQGIPRDASSFDAALGVPVPPTTDVNTYAGMLGTTINYALIGNEIVQFQFATINGDGFVELRNINRGLFNTDRYTQSHTVGETCIFMSNNVGAFDVSAFATVFGHPEPEKVAPEEHEGYPYHDTQIFGISALPNQYQLPFVGRVYSWNQIPPNPNVYSFLIDGGGDAVAVWAPRDRFLSSEWLNADGDEVSDSFTLRETTESYTVYFHGAGTFDGEDATTYFKKVTTTNRTATFTAAEQTAAGFDPVTDPLYIRVVPASQHSTGLDPWMLFKSFYLAPEIN